MRTCPALLLGLIASSLWSTGGDEKAKQQDQEPQPDVALSYLEAAAGNESKLRKVNGVTLDIRAKTENKFEGDVIVVAWTLSYDGPRPPLVIVEPTLEKKTNGATTLRVFAVPEGKKAGWTYTLWSPKWEKRPLDPSDFSPDNGYQLPKEAFVQPGLDKPAKGEIRIPAGQLRKHLADVGAAKLFDPKTPPRCFVEMAHEPTDRGERHGLDAWTGKLCSDIVEVPQLKNW